MLFPTLNEIGSVRQWCDTFYGYNHNLRIGEGEFYHMKNMTGDHFPVLSPRGKRHIAVASTDSARGLIDKDALCYVDGESFYINKKGYNIGLTIEYEEDDNGVKKIKPKRLVSMGAYVIIMPDKKYININDPDRDRGEIEARFTSSGVVQFTMSMMDGEAYDVHVGAGEPEDKKKAWIDTSSKPHQFKIYSEATEKWTSVSTTYVKIASDGIGDKFSVGDGVTLSGITAAGAKELDGVSAVIVSRGKDFIVITGILSNVGEQNDAISVVRAMPDMDYICESGNRLWGCRYYELDEHGLPVRALNEIYASKLGDFRNWNSFQGTAADSYSVTVGTDGAFTGATTHLGYPIFFKENYMHKIFGNYPSNYQVQTTACRGVQRGCADSIATVNEVLYYKSRSGVVAYDGSLPTEISAALGDEVYHSARAGALGNKYYISMADSNDEWHLFVYDTKRATWHREDGTEAVAFCSRRGDLYYIDYEKKQILSVKGINQGEPEEHKPIEWEAVTGIIGTDSPDKKYVSGIDVRMKLAVGTTVAFYAEYDSSGEWEFLFNMTGVDLRSFAVPVMPQRCDHMRLRIVGAGDAKIFSICKTVFDGSNE